MTMEGLRFVETWINKSSDIRLATVSFLILIVFTRLIWKRSILRKEKDVPQPPTLPIIGNLHQLGRFPYLSLMELARHYGPIMSLRLGSIRMLVVSNPEMAEEILKSNDALWASRPNTLVRENLLYNYQTAATLPANELWRNLRKLYASVLLSPTNVAKNKDQRHESVMLTVNSILASQNDNQPVDMLSAVADLNYHHLTRLIFGKKATAEDNWRSIGESKTIPELVRQAASLSLFALGNLFPSLEWLDLDRVAFRLRKLNSEFDNYLDKQIQARRQHLQANDAIDGSTDFALTLLSLLDRNDENWLNLSSVKGAFMDMILGGTDTPPSTLGYAMAEIMKHPEIKRKLVKELDDVVGRDRLVEESDVVNLKYMKMVIKETLRLHPPLPLLLPRLSIAPSVVAGYHIPANTQAIVNVFAIHRDPKVWEDPLSFKPERFLDCAIDVRGQDFQLLPFGAGRRICPAVNMALAFVEFVLAQLFHTLDIQLPPGMKPEDVNLTDKPGAASTLANPLNFVLRPRLAQKVYISKLT